jgi:hypothetical protein
LRRLLKLTRAEAAPPGPAQAGFFDAPPGPVHAGSPPEAKVALLGVLFAARTDLYAVRWENTHAGQGNRMLHPWHMAVPLAAPPDSQTGSHLADPRGSYPSGSRFFGSAVPRQISVDPKDLQSRWIGRQIAPMSRQVF